MAVFGYVRVFTTSITQATKAAGKSMTARYVISSLKNSFFHCVYALTSHEYPPQKKGSQPLILPD